jgi:putative zinc finger/helix-turn-helix YgiT family protein
MMCANCGKNAKRAAFVDGFDLTELAGVPAMVERMRVYRCSSCGHETVSGPDLEHVLNGLTVAVAAREGRLTGDEARFLRKRLRLTQDELGVRLGANKITISDWERGAETISKHYDYILRGLVLASLKIPEPRILYALSGVHEDVPRKHKPVVLPAFLMNDSNVKERTRRH